MKNKIFVLGLDGATLKLLDRKELPTFQRLIRRGISGTLLSRPAITSVAWPSMVSGVNAGKHNIFDFRRGDDLKLSIDKKAKELWDYVKTIAINVPMTFPVREIDGVMISGMMTPSLDSKCVHPEKEKDFLKSINYAFEPDITPTSIEEGIKTKFKLIDRYINFDYELFFIVFREYDVIQHFFWNDNLEYYQLMDQYLKNFLKEHNEITHFFVVSDHGFTKIDKTFNLEKFIEQQAYSQFIEVGGWGALYLKDKSIKETVVDSLRDFKDNGKTILDVYPREEIYWGPYAKEGPDIVVSPKRQLGYTLGMRTNEVIEKSDKKNGCHLEKGVVVLTGKDIIPTKKDYKIFDIFPTILKLLGKEIPDGIDGKSMI